MTDLKPGDVVLHPEYGRGIVQDGPSGWVVFVNGANRCLHEIADNLRRLVVIDPEDREQAERLLDVMKGRGWTGLNDEAPGDMQAALREYANPKPPKPEEPTHLNADDLDRVIREAKEEAWREGLHEGVTRVAFPRWPKQPNPYREQEGREK